MAKISVIVCTYNRDYILRDCLDSLTRQSANKSCYEVIIINNNSTDTTQKIAEEYAKNHLNFRVFFESRQGLSAARNRGYKEAKYDWISYIDDDAKAFPNFVERAIYTIEKFDFDCFGGMYYPWYRNSVRPKWLPTNFGQSVRFKNGVEVLDNGFINGSTCIFRKKPLESIGGFSEVLGMIGNKIAYGEEVYVQNQLVTRGYKVGFDPELCIEHLVPEYKLTLKWHVRSAFAHGRDSVKITGKKEAISFTRYGLAVLKIFFKRLFSSVNQLIKRKDYYIQNFVLDIAKPIARYSGYFYANRNKMIENG